jgi:Cytochrome c554 and c-prime
MLHCAALLSVTLLLVVPQLSGPAKAQAGLEKLPNLVKHQTIGTVNCANSTCHGATVPLPEARVLQNEYTTWLRLDKHAKAYAVLLNEKSRSIMKNLGMKEAAHESKLCLDCHAHNPAPGLRGERHFINDGIGCEACHGPAEKWISSHTVPNTPVSDNIKNGMYPTNEPVAQAKLCLSCHFGDSSRFVTHKLMGAGHPRMSFELESFGNIEPAHVRYGNEWNKRKGEYNSIRIWAIGQALASKQLLDILMNPKLGRDGLFPELVLFDCHSCHHRMTDKKATARLGIGPGQMRLNDSNLLMLRAIVSTVDPAGALAFNQQVGLLHHAVVGNPEAKGANALDVAQKVSVSIDDYTKKFERYPFDVAALRKVLQALIVEGSKGQYADYSGAEQVYLSVSSLCASLNRQNGLKMAAKVNQQLTLMRKTLADEEKFVPELFSNQLATIQTLISSQTR